MASMLFLNPPHALLHRVLVLALPSAWENRMAPELHLGLCSNVTSLGKPPLTNLSKMAASPLSCFIPSPPAPTHPTLTHGCLLQVLVILWLKPFFGQELCSSLHRGAGQKCLWGSPQPKTDGGWWVNTQLPYLSMGQFRGLLYTVFQWSPVGLCSGCPEITYLVTHPILVPFISLSHLLTLLPVSWHLFSDKSLAFKCFVIGLALEGTQIQDPTHPPLLAQCPALNRRLINFMEWMNCHG